MLSRITEFGLGEGIKSFVVRIEEVTGYFEKC
jgi:hypothetical protein